MSVLGTGSVQVGEDCAIMGQVDGLRAEGTGQRKGLDADRTAVDWWLQGSVPTCRQLAEQR